MFLVFTLTSCRLNLNKDFEMSLVARKTILVATNSSKVGWAEFKPTYHTTIGKELKSSQTQFYRLSKLK